MLQYIYVSLRKVEVVQLYVTVLTTNGTIILKYIAGDYVIMYKATWDQNKSAENHWNFPMDLFFKRSRLYVREFATKP